jgi:hypothetical protein
MLLTFRTFRTSNGPYLFAMSFFGEVEELEKKSTGNAMRRKRGPTILMTISKCVNPLGLQVQIDVAIESSP